MIHRYIKIAFINLFIFACALFLLGFFGDDTKKITNTANFKIITTSPVFENILKNIAGDGVSVELIETSGIEPHDFEPTALDITRLDQADIIIAIGNGFEPWLTKFQKSNTKKNILYLAPLLNLKERSTDPHFWLNPDLVLNSIEIIKQELKNSTVLVDTRNIEQQLAQLNFMYEQRLAGCKIKKYISLHGAYGYMFEKSGIQGIGLKGINSEEEISIEKLKDAIDTIRNNNESYVIIDESESVNKSLLNIAREFGINILVINPLEIAPKTYQNNYYIDNMISNLNIAAEGFKCLN